MVNAARSTALDLVEAKISNGAAYFKAAHIRGISCNGVARKGENGIYLVANRVPTEVEVNDLSTDEIVSLIEAMEGGES